VTTESDRSSVLAAKFAGPPMGGTRLNGCISAVKQIGRLQRKQGSTACRAPELGLLSPQCDI
jgi:hypothetical protein